MHKAPYIRKKVKFVISRRKIVKVPMITNDQHRVVRVMADQQVEENDRGFYGLIKWIE
jgi:hypothetical protein